MGDQIGALPAGEDDAERLAQVADLIEFSEAEELLGRVRRLLVDGDGVLG